MSNRNVKWTDTLGEERKELRHVLSDHFRGLGPLSTEERRWVDGEVFKRLREGRGYGPEELENIGAHILADAKERFHWHAIPEQAYLDLNSL